MTKQALAAEKFPFPTEFPKEYSQRMKNDELADIIEKRSIFIMGYDAAQVGNLQTSAGNALIAALDKYIKTLEKR